MSTQCKWCGKPGASPSGGYHVDCFIEAVNQKQTHSTRFEFATGRTVESEDPPISAAAFQRILDEALRKQREEQLQKELDEAEAKAKAKIAEEQTRKQQAHERDFWSHYDAGSWWRNSTYNASTKSTSTDTGVQVSIDAKRIMQLLRLCHPDKHDNSELATEVTQWLLEIKARLESK